MIIERKNHHIGFNYTNRLSCIYSNSDNDYIYTFRVEPFYINNIIVGAEILTQVKLKVKNNYIDPEQHFRNIKTNDLIVFLKQLNTYIEILKKQLTNNKISLSINISPDWLLERRIKTLLRKITSRLIMSNVNIIFELNENSEIYNGKHCKIDELNNEINAFNQMGVRFYLDDFGNGSSNFKLLREIKVSGVKVDKYLFWELFKKDKQLLNSLINYLIYNFDSVVVEGVEEKKHSDYLNNKNCIQQGYWFNNKSNTISILNIDYKRKQLHRV